MSNRAGGAISGALGGAGMGASIGSLFPGIGTAIGGLAGGLLGGIGGYFTSKEDKVHQLPTQTPEQSAVLQKLLEQIQQQGGQGGNYQAAQDYLGKLLSSDPEAYDRFAQPYMQQFEQQTVPRLAERFAGMGGAHGGGSLSSSGFAQSLGGAASDLQSRLAQVFSGRQQEAANQAMGNYNSMLGMGLGTQNFENVYQPGNTGIGGALIGGLANTASTAGNLAMLQQLLKQYNENKPSSTDYGTGVSTPTG